jgi:hypothetical protein
MTREQLQDTVNVFGWLHDLRKRYDAEGRSWAANELSLFLNGMIPPMFKAGEQFPSEPKIDFKPI